ncbi:uncharacterized protein RAG0_10371 [Rhynchosporium agropyri]|uniref:Uncharacterized protein n=1 Tax=Rhynchosporium agropyri TaxID=914238 RepID=A0A1E1L288_9HELO|nr:uncharacterized protein RAG0_10371 [Rhynchosporium agropyri]
MAGKLCTWYAPQNEPFNNLITLNISRILTSHTYHLLSNRSTGSAQASPNTSLACLA